jgi:phage-related protein
VIPEFVDPDYIYVLVNSDVKYRPQGSVTNKSDIVSVVSAGIKSYLDSNIGVFLSGIDYSNLVAFIDKLDGNIVSNQTRLRLKRKLQPVFNTITTYSVPFRNPIQQGSVYSDAFLISVDGQIKTCYLRDGESITVSRDSKGLVNTVGVIQLVDYETGEIYKDVGSIVYTASDSGQAGFISFGLNIGSLQAQKFDLELYATPQDLNIAGYFNTILTVDNESVDSIKVAVK